MIKKGYILNYLQASHFIPTEPTAIVRIFDPGAKYFPLSQNRVENCSEVKLQESNLWTKVIETSFCDIDVDMYKEHDPESLSFIYEQYGDELFTEQHADNIMRQFSTIPSKTTSYVFHCNAGLSRSVAIAKSLNKIFNLSLEWQGRARRLDYNGNTTIYRKMCERAIK